MSEICSSVGLDAVKLTIYIFTNVSRFHFNFSFNLQNKVRLCDATTRIVLLSVSREFCSMIRASLTLLTSLPIPVQLQRQSVTTTKKNAPSTSSKRQPELQGRQQTVVVSVISVNGSIRTAKLATMGHIRHSYRQRILLKQRRQDTKESDYLCRAMHETLRKIHAMD